jgi:hypothetical protein
MVDNTIGVECMKELLKYKLAIISHNIISLNKNIDVLRHTIAQYGECKPDVICVQET